MIKWTILKDGKPQPYAFKSKRSLLISFDMMPLIGLRNMEKRLVAKGKPPIRVKVVKDDSGGYFAFQRNGVLDLNWETLSETDEGSYGQAAQRESLPWYIFTNASNIAPKRTAKVREKTIAELNRRGIDVVKVKLVPLME